MGAVIMGMGLSERWEGCGTWLSESMGVMVVTEYGTMGGGGGRCGSGRSMAERRSSWPPDLLWTILRGGFMGGGVSLSALGGEIRSDGCGLTEKSRNLAAMRGGSSSGLPSPLSSELSSSTLAE